MSNIKILAISNIFGNHANLIQIMKMADAFSQTGKKVEVYLPGWGKSQSSLVWQLRFGIKHDFKIIFVPHLSIRKKFVIITFAVASFLKSFKWSNDTVIITRNERVASFLGRTGKKILFENHTFTYSSKKITQNYRKRVKSLMKKSRVYMITISNRLKELWIEFGIASEKILVAHDGVDVDQFGSIAALDKDEIRNQVGLPFEKKIVGYVGSLYKDRGIDFILDAASFYKDQNLLFLIIGGSSTERQLYEDRAQDLDVVFIGHIHNSRVPLYLRSSDLLVMPYQDSVVTIDGCSPMKVFEYLASGSHILSPHFPSFHEVLKDFDGITFYASKDKDKFISEIGHILSTPETKSFYNRLDKLKAYSWKTRSQDILNFYSQSFST